MPAHVGGTGADASEQIACLVLLSQVVDEGDGHNGRQLEGPPYHHLHGEQRIANPGSDAGEDECYVRYVRIDLVEHGQVLPVTLGHYVLPDVEGEQDRWEDEADQSIGDEHDAEQYDDEGQHHQRRVDDGSVAHLLALEPDIEAQEDGLEEPGDVDDEPCAHLYEVTLCESPDQHDDDGEEGDADDVVEHRPLDLEVRSAPLLRQEPSQHDVADAECQGEVEDEEDADEQHGGTAPLGVKSLVPLEGFVLHVDGGFRHHHLHGQRSKDAEVVGTAVAEDVLLQQAVSALSVFVELQHLLSYTLVVGVLRFEVLQEALHVAPYCVGKEDAGIAVPPLCPCQEERFQRLLFVVGNLLVLLLHDGNLLFVHRFASDEQGVLLAGQRVDGLEEDAVAAAEDAVGIDDGRHSLERADEVVGALNLLLQSGDELVVLPHLAVAAVQVALQVSSLLAGIRHVEGVVGGL